MATNKINTRIVHKHETEANWKLATNFIPMKAELIVYDIDENYAYERFKIGDGITNVNDLPFADKGVIEYGPNNGIIFNNTNTANGENALAGGTNTKSNGEASFGFGTSSISGGLAFNITNYSHDSTDNIHTFTLDSVKGIEVGDTYSCQLSNCFDFSGTVSSIDSTTLQVVCTGTDKYAHGLNGPNGPKGTTGYFWLPYKPEVGTTLKESYNTVAIGQSNIAHMRGAVALGV